MNDDIFDKAPEHDKVQEVDLKERMESFFIDYAMSVIASRALPDVRDETCSRIWPAGSGCCGFGNWYPF